MKTQKPSRAEVVAGILLVGVAAVGAGYLTTHQDAQNAYTWGAAGITGIVGLWLWVPLKAQAIWHELRAALPVLKDPPADDGHNHG